MSCCEGGAYVQVRIDRDPAAEAGGSGDVERTRAAMCLACERSRPSEGGGGTRACEAWVRDRICPLGRAPGPTLAVRWRGRRWRGVPVPVRLRIAWSHGIGCERHAGCGCDLALKARVERLAAGLGAVPAWAAWVALGAGAVAAAIVAGA